MKKHLPALVAGFGAGVLQVVPIIKSFSCLIIMPLAGIFALVLYQKSNKIITPISTQKAVVIGLMTGVFAGLFGTFFEILITFITKSNDLVYVVNDLYTFIEEFPVDQTVKSQVIELTESVVNSIKTTGFSFLYSFSVLVNNLIINPIFGLIGALIGLKFINSKIQQNL